MEDDTPAFPHARTGTHESGMSLRDYMAGQALIGLMSDKGLRPNCLGEFDNMAARLYQVADAVLKARG